jgi:hypothetical protein
MDSDEPQLELRSPLIAKRAGTEGSSRSAQQGAPHASEASSADEHPLSSHGYMPPAPRLAVGTDGDEADDGGTDSGPEDSVRSPGTPPPGGSSKKSAGRGATVEMWSPQHVPGYSSETLRHQRPRLPPAYRHPLPKLSFYGQAPPAQRQRSKSRRRPGHRQQDFPAQVGPATRSGDDEMRCTVYCVATALEHSIAYHSVLLRYAVLHVCYALLRSATLCYALLRSATLCYAMLCSAMLCYAMLCYAMLCYAMPCHAMPC